MFKLLVDFNEVRDDRVRGLQRYAEGPRTLRQGDWVLVHDDGEEEAWGGVEAVEGDLVRVRVDWRTFGPAGRFHNLPNGTWVVRAAIISTGDDVVEGPLLPQSGRPRLLRVLGASDPDLVRDEDEHSAELPV
jgi:hypothetical protein